MKKFFLLLSLQYCLYTICFAQAPGQLDSSFSIDGIAALPGTHWMDIALQPDGKLLAVGDLIARFELNGNFDGTFATDSIKVGYEAYRCNAVGIQQDGKIVVVGGNSHYSGNDSFLLLRYQPDGSLDSTFDGDGASIINFGFGFDDVGHDLTIQPDGKIVVAGKASNGELALARFHINGSLDSTFGVDGKVVVNAINAGSASYVKLQADGKVLVSSGARMVRLNSDGSPDNSFGTNGVIALSGWMGEFVILQDGKIAWAGGSECFIIVKLNADGSLDNGFGNSGFANICATEGEATSIALQADGRFLVGGYTTAGMLNNLRNFLLVRSNYDGTIDSSFGSYGKVVTTFPGFVDESQSFTSVITPDFKIVLAGYQTMWLNGGFMARYHLGWLEWPVDANTVAGNVENFMVSPNPASDQVDIEASGIENGIWHLELRDVAGRQILQEEIVATNGSIQKKVLLNDLPEGLYMLQLDNGVKRTVSKLVKCR